MWDHYKLTPMLCSSHSGYTEWKDLNTHLIWQAFRLTKNVARVKSYLRHLQAPVSKVVSFSAASANIWYVTVSLLYTMYFDKILSWPTRIYCMSYIRNVDNISLYRMPSINKNVILNQDLLRISLLETAKISPSWTNPGFIKWEKSKIVILFFRTLRFRTFPNTSVRCIKKAMAYLSKITYSW